MDDHDDGRLFTQGELALFRYTAVLLSAVLMSSLVAFVIWILGRLISVFYNLLLPLSIAGVMALVLNPAVGFLKRRLGLTHLSAVASLLTGFMIAVGGLVTIVLPSAIDQVATLGQALPDIVTRTSDTLSRAFPTLWSFILARIENWQSETELSELEFDLAERFMSYTGLLVGVLAVPFFLFFALLSGKDIREHAVQWLAMFAPDTRKEIVYLVEIFVRFVTTFFQGQVIIALIVGILLATGFSLIELQVAIVAGLLLGFLNIVPFLGIIVGLLIVLPMAYLQPGGGIELMVLALAVFVVVQLIDSWVLTPKILGDRSGLHPAVVVISIFFWGIALGGVIGMILAVPLTAFVAALWRHVRMRLAQRLVSPAVELSPQPAAGGQDSVVRGNP